MNGLTVIKVPARFQAKLDKTAKLQKAAAKKKSLPDFQNGEKLIPFITCKKKELNLYRGQTYGKFDQVPLASKGWAGRKASGDYFNLHKIGVNSAFNSVKKETFNDLGLDQRIVSQFKELGFNEPTNIQRLAIPEILSGSNTVVAAETGNGKTYSFIAPIIHNILKQRSLSEGTQPRFNSPKALVIVPGRELVIQTRNMARDLGNPYGVQVNSVIGGSIQKKMLNPSMRQIDILVASLGALRKLTASGVYNITEVQHIVLDEADTLLDDSFNEETVHYLSKFPIRGIAAVDAGTTSEDMSGIQLTLAGATFPTSLKVILKDVVEVDSLVHLKTKSLHRLSGHVQHNFHRYNDSERTEHLLRIARNNYIKKKPTIIFSNSNVGSDYISLFLNGNDIPCVNLNGSIPTPFRKDQFEKFKSGSVLFLSSTDVGSRGLNTPWVQEVINFDCPHFISDYVHRSGRTGRVGSGLTSVVTTFVTSKAIQVSMAQQIEYAARKRTELPNVNANIKRKIVGMADKQEELRALEEHMENLSKTS